MGKFGGIFLEDFLEKFFDENFLGGFLWGVFWEKFFVYIGIDLFVKILFFVRLWGNAKRKI